jgi:exonuclease-1
MKRNRDTERAKGMAFLRDGNRNMARECFKKAVDITPEMAYNLIKASIEFLHLVTLEL